MIELSVTQSDRELRQAILTCIVEQLDRPCGAGDMIDDRTAALDIVIARHRLAATATREPGEAVAFQAGVDQWMDACFGDTIKRDMIERADRFIEESLELAQTFPGFGADRAHALVDYVFSRSIGERPQEIGGVMVTLAALCNAAGEDMDAAGRIELARIWTKVEAIRAKQAAKPTGSALPIAAPPAPVVPTTNCYGIGHTGCGICDACRAHGGAK